jgi:hypothetical protein
MSLERRRFLPPWTADETDACFIVKNHNGQALAYVYFQASDVDSSESGPDGRRCWGHLKRPLLDSATPWRLETWRSSGWTT